MSDDLSSTYTEITSQTVAWAAALRAIRTNRWALQALWAETHDQVLYTGCGSTYCLSLAAAVLAQDSTGVIARALPASELALYPRSSYPRNGQQTLLIAVSRSGRTTETLRAVEAFREARKGKVIAITNDPQAPLVSLSDLAIPIPDGQEKSITETRSFASMLVATTAMSLIFAGRDDLLAALGGLVPAGDRLVRDYEGLARRWGEDGCLAAFYFLGSGPRYGLACEASLKMKEMSLTASEPFHFPEFRHGPQSMVRPDALVVGLLSDATRPHEQAVLREVRDLGGQTLSLGEEEADASFASGLPEAVRDVLYLPILQLMAYYRAVCKGLNPDRPQNLSAFVELEWPVHH